MARFFRINIWKRGRHKLNVCDVIVPFCSPAGKKSDWRESELSRERINLRSDTKRQTNGTTNLQTVDIRQEKRLSYVFKYS